MELQQLIQEEIKKHLEDELINTVKLRTSKVHGVAGATIYNMIHTNYIPSTSTIKKLLDGFGYSYSIAFGGFEDVKKKDENDN
jgi:hypothetical protein